MRCCGFLLPTCVLFSMVVMCCSVTFLLPTCVLFLWLLHVVAGFVTYLCVVSMVVMCCCGFLLPTCALFLWLLCVVVGFCYLPVHCFYGCYVLLLVFVTYLCVVSMVVMCCCWFLLPTCALFLWLLCVVVGFCYLPVHCFYGCYVLLLSFCYKYLCIVSMVVTDCCGLLLPTCVLFLWLLRIVAGCCYLPVRCF